MPTKTSLYRQKVHDDPMVKQRLSTDAMITNGEPNYLAKCCQTPDCFGITTYSWLIAAFLTLFTASTVLFIYYASQNAQNTQCRFTYTLDNDVKETEMLGWADKDDFDISRPHWNDAAHACVCDTDPNPKKAKATRKTPVWLSPGDLVILFPNHLSNDFKETYAYRFAPEDHVKVCLENQQLDSLWHSGNCHFDTNNSTDIYTGWDGALFCAAGACQSNPNSKCKCDTMIHGPYCYTIQIDKPKCSDLCKHKGTCTPLQGHYGGGSWAVTCPSSSSESSR